MTTDGIAISVLARGIACHLLLLASSGPKKCLVQLGDNGVILKLTVPRSICRKSHVSFVLNERIIPSAENSMKVMFTSLDNVGVLLIYHEGAGS